MTLCEKCGKPTRYECISSDADGNRREYANVCTNNDCEYGGEVVAGIDGNEETELENETD